MNREQLKEIFPRILPWLPALFLALSLIILPAAFCQKKVEQAAPMHEKGHMKKRHRRKVAEAQHTKNKKRHSRHGFRRKLNRKKTTSPELQPVETVAPDVAADHSTD